MKFDFDEWVKLAKEDLSSFEEHRLKLIKATLIKVRPERRPALESLQFRIDMMRLKSKTPMESCMRLSAMMDENFRTNFWPAMKGVSKARNSSKKKGTIKGKIIPFRRPESNE